jgi:hypothetical protein
MKLSKKERKEEKENKFKRKKEANKLNKAFPRLLLKPGREQLGFFWRYLWRMIAGELAC